ncbi:MAG: hypothetical protein ABL898_03455 [Hyphomicrobiaceae bacterium]
MPTVAFTQNIQRHVDCPERSVAGATVREALDAFFAETPLARGYVLDDQGGLRRHMTVFVDGVLIRDRSRLSDPVGAQSRIYVFQSLSGG